MRFRRKPPEFDAEQYHEGRAPPEGVTMSDHSTDPPTPAFVVTATGRRVTVADGDWVVSDAGGYDVIPAAVMPTIADPVEP